MTFPGDFRRALGRIERREVEGAGAGCVRNQRKNFAVSWWSPSEQGFRAVFDFLGIGMRHIVKNRFTHDGGQSLQ